MPDDLDRLETLAKAAMADISWGWEASGIGAEFIAAADPPTVLALVAELRAAREVVEEARMWSSAPNTDIMPYAAQRDLHELVAAYDQAAGHADR